MNEATAASIELASAPDTLLLSDTLRLRATVRSTANQPLARTIVWATSDARVASVDDAGLVTAVAEGAVSITASADGRQAAKQLTIKPRPVGGISIIQPTSDSIIAGDSVELAISIRDDLARPLTGRLTTWRSRDTLVAAVSSSGMVRGLSVGTTYITASAENRTDSLRVRVVPERAAAVSFQPAPDTLLVADTLRLAVRVTSRNNRVLTDRPAAWTSSNQAVAVVDQTGRVIGTAAGTTTINVVVDSVRATRTITVKARPLATLRINPLAIDSIIVGDSLRLTITMQDDRGNAATGHSVVWSSRDTVVARVTPTGVIHARTTGSTYVNVSAEGRSDSVRIRVVPPPRVASIQIDLQADRILEGAQTEVARAVTLGANGDTLRGRRVAWSSSAPGVLVVDSSGRIDPVASGTAELIAVSEGVRATHVVVVEPRSAYQHGQSDQFNYVDGRDPRMPTWDAARQGHVPAPGDQREQIVIDETFNVPAGTITTWNNKIIWVRPRARNNIHVAGTLNIRNSLILWDQQQADQTRLLVMNGGTLRIWNSYAFNARPFFPTWEYKDGSTLDFNHFQTAYWTTISGRSNYNARNATHVRLTIFADFNGGSITASDAAQFWLEMFPPPGRYQVTLPRRLFWQDVQTAPFWPGATVSAVRSWVMQTDVALTNGVHMTINNTDAAGIGWTISATGQTYIECELRDFGVPNWDPAIAWAGDDQGTFYSNKTWDMPCNNSSLTLNNTRLLPSWPNIFGAVKLKIYNSNMVDPTNHGSGAAPYPVMEIYNSTMVQFAARERGTAYLENSGIRQFVQANGDGSAIYSFSLIGTRGPLTVFEDNGGRYIPLSAPGAPWK